MHIGRNGRSIPQLNQSNQGSNVFGFSSIGNSLLSLSTNIAIPRPNNGSPFYSIFTDSFTNLNLQPNQTRRQRPPFCIFQDHEIDNSVSNNELVVQRDVIADFMLGHSASRAGFRLDAYLSPDTFVSLFRYNSLSSRALFPIDRERLGTSSTQVTRQTREIFFASPFLQRIHQRVADSALNLFGFARDAQTQVVDRVQNPSSEQLAWVYSDDHRQLLLRVLRSLYLLGNCQLAINIRVAVLAELRQRLSFAEFTRVRQQFDAVFDNIEALPQVNIASTSQPPPPPPPSAGAAAIATTSSTTSKPRSKRKISDAKFTHKKPKLTEQKEDRDSYLESIASLFEKPSQATKKLEPLPAQAKKMSNLADVSKAKIEKTTQSKMLAQRRLKTESQPLKLEALQAKKVSRYIQKGKAEKLWVERHLAEKKLSEARSQDAEEAAQIDESAPDEGFVTARAVMVFLDDSSEKADKTQHAASTSAASSAVSFIKIIERKAAENIEHSQPVALSSAKQTQLLKAEKANPLKSIVPIKPIKAELVYKQTQTQRAKTSKVEPIKTHQTQTVSPEILTPRPPAPTPQLDEELIDISSLFEQDETESLLPISAEIEQHLTDTARVHIPETEEIEPPPTPVSSRPATPDSTPPEDITNSLSDEPSVTQDSTQDTHSNQEAESAEQSAAEESTVEESTEQATDEAQAEEKAVDKSKEQVSVPPSSSKKADKAQHAASTSAASSAVSFIKIIEKKAPENIEHSQPVPLSSAKQTQLLKAEKANPLKSIVPLKPITPIKAELVYKQTQTQRAKTSKVEPIKTHQTQTVSPEILTPRPPAPTPQLDEELIDISSLFEQDETTSTLPVDAEITQHLIDTATVSAPEVSAEIEPPSVDSPTALSRPPTPEAEPPETTEIRLSDEPSVTQDLTEDLTEDTHLNQETESAEQSTAEESTEQAAAQAQVEEKAANESKEQVSVPPSSLPIVSTLISEKPAQHLPPAPTPQLDEELIDISSLFEQDETASTLPVDAEIEQHLTDTTEVSAPEELEEIEQPTEDVPTAPSRPATPDSTPPEEIETRLSDEPSVTQDLTEDTHSEQETESAEQSAAEESAEQAAAEGTIEGAVGGAVGGGVITRVDFDESTLFDSDTDSSEDEDEDEVDDLSQRRSRSLFTLAGREDETSVSAFRRSYKAIRRRKTATKHSFLGSKRFKSEGALLEPTEEESSSTKQPTLRARFRGMSLSQLLKSPSISDYSVTNFDASKPKSFRRILKKQRKVLKSCFKPNSDFSFLNEMMFNKFEELTSHLAAMSWFDGGSRFNLLKAKVSKLVIDLQKRYKVEYEEASAIAANKRRLTHYITTLNEWMNTPSFSFDENSLGEYQAMVQRVNSLIAQSHAPTKKIEDSLGDNQKLLDAAKELLKQVRTKYVNSYNAALEEHFKRKQKK